MALQLQNGNYVRILEVSPQGSARVSFGIYRSSKIREDEKGGDLPQFENVVISSEYTPDLDIDVMADETKSIRDNMISAGYVALKALPHFADAQDV